MSPRRTQHGRPQRLRRDAELVRLPRERPEHDQPQRALGFAVTDDAAADELRAIPYKAMSGWS